MKKAWLNFWHGAVLGTLWQIRRQLAWNKTGGICYYCKEVLTEKTFTVDHVVPQAQGGQDSLSNLVPCCKYCNRLKADRSLSSGLLDQMRDLKDLRDKHLPKLRQSRFTELA